MRASLIVEAQVAADRSACIADLTLSRQAPLPSMLTPMLCLVMAKPVN
jgi:hypothetical protein